MNITVPSTMNPDLLHDPTIVRLRTPDGYVWRRHHSLPGEGEHHPTGLWSAPASGARVPRRGVDLTVQGAIPAAGVPVFHPGQSPSGRGTATLTPTSDGLWTVHAATGLWMPGQEPPTGELIHTGRFTDAVSALHDWDESTHPAMYGTVDPDTITHMPPARDPWIQAAFGTVTNVTVPRQGIAHVTLTDPDNGQRTTVIVLSPERNQQIPAGHRDPYGWYFDWEEFGPVPAYQPRALGRDPHMPLCVVEHRGRSSWQATVEKMNERAGTDPTNRFRLSVFTGMAEDAESFLVRMSEEEEIAATVDPDDPTVMRVTVRFGGEIGAGPGRVVLVPVDEYNEVTGDGEFPFSIFPGVTYPEA